MGLGAWLRKYKGMEQLEKELAEWKSRALRAEKFWSERQMDVADGALKLQMEKDRAASEQAKYFMQFARLLTLIRKRLFGSFNITLTTALDKDDKGYFLKDGLALVFSPNAVISLFCDLLGLPEERFWEDLSEGWKMNLQGRIRDDFGVARKDDFSNLGGKLYAAGHCGMCNHKR